MSAGDIQMQLRNAGTRGDRRDTLLSVCATRFTAEISEHSALSKLPVRWSTGTVELEHYQLIRFLDAGAMGVVFEARDKRSGQRVALKTLLHRTAQSIVSLKHEFRAVSDLVHPNLALSYELAFDEDVPYLVMEFVDGVDFLSYVYRASSSGSVADFPSSSRETLLSSDPMSRGVQIDFERLRESLQQLLLGIGALHRADLLHLDLKPANVLVEATGRVVVLDFGLVDAATGARPDAPLVFRGTPAYMAPEQCSGFADRPADLYAVGVMLFEALTGDLPFLSGPTDLLRKQRQDAPPVASLVSGLPEDLTLLCDELLSRSPALRPTAEQVLDRLGRGRIAPSSRGSAPSQRPFVARTAELELLTRAHAAVSETGAVHVYIGGASGIGKTTLLRRFLSQLQSSEGALVLQSRCYERESVPYKAVDGVIDALSSHVRGLLDEVEDLPALLRVFPALGAERREPDAGDSFVDPHDCRQRAFRALKSLFRKLTRNHRIVIAIDDLQWGDLDSARLFREIFASGNAPPVLVVGTYRSDEVERSACLRELLREDAGADIRRIMLEPLCEGDARDLARLLLDGAQKPDEVLADHVARESGGNPFFVDSLLRYHTLTRGASNPASLRDVVSGFLDELDEDGKRLIRLLAVAGEPLAQSVALDAASVEVERYAIFAKLRSLRLVRTRGARAADVAEIYHDRIRHSICLELSPAELRDVHRTLAESLERTESPEPERLAHHFHAAGKLSEAGRYARSSAERASTLLAFERAASLYGLAVECQPDDAELRIRYAEALERAGRCADAAQQFLDCSRRVASDSSSVLERSAARQLLLAGRVEDGLALLRPHMQRLRLTLPNSSARVKWSIATHLVSVRLRGIRFRPVAAGDVDPSLLARIDAGIAVVDGLTGADPMTAASVMLQTLRLSLAAGEPARIAWSLAQYGLFSATSGTEKAAAAGEELLARAEYLSRTVEDASLEGTLLVARARAALTVGRFGQALSAADACVRHFREKCIRNAGLVAVAENVALFALESLGSFEQLQQRARARLQLAEAVGDLYSQITARTYVAVAALACDDVELPVSVLREAAAWRPAGPFLFQNWLLLKAQTLLDLYRGRAAQAFNRLGREWPGLERSHLLRLQFVRIFARRLRATAALAALRGGELEPAKLLAHAAADAAELERQGRPYATAGAAAIRGGIAAFRQRIPEATLEYTRAAAAYEHASMPVEAACCRLRRAGLSGGSAQEIEDAEGQLSRSGIKAASRYAVLHAP